jgi:hypothetical protein
MTDPTTTLNLSESLRSTAIDLTEAAAGVAKLGSDEEEIKLQAEILDRIAEDATEGASILRAMVSRQRAPALPPRRIPPDNVSGTRRIPPDRDT